MINIDTDLIIPKQYLKNVTRKGLGEGLFRDLVYVDDQTLNPEFVLNKPAFKQVSILIAGDNFGCGSSREHAQWALLDKGIVCVISTSFADIFYTNCINNGILPACISAEALEMLFSLRGTEGPIELSVDLIACRIGLSDGSHISLAIQDGDRRTLMEGLDPIARTLSIRDEISAFDQRRTAAQPWL